VREKIRALRRHSPHDRGNTVDRYAFLIHAADTSTQAGIGGSKAERIFLLINRRRGQCSIEPYTNTHDVES
jgi:hypothetical protein